MNIYQNAPSRGEVLLQIKQRNIGTLHLLSEYIEPVQTDYKKAYSALEPA